MRIYKRKRTKDGTLELGRRSFITSLVAIVMIPLSAAVGYYMNKLLQRPDLTIVYVNRNYITESDQFSAEAIQSIQNDPETVTNLRETIQKLSSQTESECTQWIVDGILPPDCQSIVRKAVTGLVDSTKAARASLQTNIRTLEGWTPSVRLILRPMAEPRIEAVIAAARYNKDDALGMLQGTLNSLDERLPHLEAIFSELTNMDGDTPRTGEVKFTFGVLNNGDADGVIYNRGTLRFADRELWIYCTLYTVVKSHSFHEITFEVGHDKETVQTYEKWIEIIKNRTEIQIELLLKTAAGKELTATLATN